jgi:hypothetical protein
MGPEHPRQCLEGFEATLAGPPEPLPRCPSARAVPAVRRYFQKRRRSSFEQVHALTMGLFSRRSTGSHVRFAAAGFSGFVSQRKRVRLNSAFSRHCIRRQVCRRTSSPARLRYWLRWKRSEGATARRNT